MWPKVFAQLVELLPHVSRLIPMAERFFASKTTSEKANEALLAAMAESVRSDLGQVTATHAGLNRQLQEQTVQSAAMAAGIRQIQVSLESCAARLHSLEKRATALAIWVKVGIGLLALVLGLLITLLARGH